MRIISGRHGRSHGRICVRVEPQLFAVVTFGTPNQQQDSSWLGLPSGIAYKEIFNSSWPAFQVESEPE